MPRPLAVSARPRRPAADRWRGCLAGCGGALAVALVLGPLHARIGRATPSLALLIPVVAAGFIGGMGPAVVAALAAAMVFLLVFIPPVGLLEVSVPADAVALGLFVAVALAVGLVVGREADRRRAAVHRADELATLHRQLEQAVDERNRLESEVRRVAVLEEIDRQRSALLRAVSHDLRTPLGTIKAIASDLRSGTPFDDRTQRTLLDLVCDEAERLDRIVANLLSLSRIEAGALEPDRRATDVGNLVEHCVDRLSRVLRSRSVKLDVAEGLPAVWADFTQIDQVLSNLLENASRYAPIGTPVVIRADAIGDHVEIGVRDEGPGVDAQLVDNLFEAFQGGGGGTGIGLAICKAIVEAHGGTIALESTEIGAGFVFSLPTAQ